MRLIDTEGPLAASSRAPVGSVTVPPDAVEVLSYSPPVAGTPGSGVITSGPAFPEGVTSYGGLPLEEQGVVLRLMGSRWSAPLALPIAAVAAAAKGGAKRSGTVPDRGADAAAAAAAQNTTYEPVVLRARSRTDGTIYEIVARFTTTRTIVGAGGSIAAAASAAAGQSLILRLDTHMVVSNRTGYSLNLIQPLERVAKGLGQGGGGGSMRVGQASTPGMVHTSSFPGAPTPLGAHAQEHGAAGESARCKAAEALTLGPGALGVPLHWGQHVLRRLLALTLAPGDEVKGPGGEGQGGQGEGGGGWLLWSEPFKMEYPGGVEMQVVVPVYCLGEAGQYNGKQSMWLRSLHHSGSAGGGPGQGAGCSKGTDPIAAAAAGAAAGAEAAAGGGQGAGLGVGGQEGGQGPAPSSTSAGPQGQGHGAGPVAISAPSIADAADERLQQAVEAAWAMLARASAPSSTTQRGGGAGPSLLRVSKQTDAGPMAFLAVLVQVNIQLVAPGCLHLVLGVLGAEPQHLVHNATTHALRFKEAHAPK